MAAYYNEIDPYATQWLRNLIAAGHIAPGDVDERSINDVKADDLKSYTQCHFFAGIGVWSQALRLAGWPDDWPVWTGSCPCQPFSAAGKQQGTADDRHLWPVWAELIRQRKPAVVFGEQVEAAIRHGWLDLVQADMEGIGYAFAAAGIPAAGFGAPHIRQRLWFVAELADAELSERRPRDFGSAVDVGQARGRIESADRIGERSDPRWLGDNNNPRLEGQRGGHQAERGRDGAVRSASEAGESGGVDIASGNRSEVWGNLHGEVRGERLAEGCNTGGVADDTTSGWREECADTGRIVVGDYPQRWPAGLGDGGSDSRPGPTNGHWRNADWLHCRDGKWRPVEPGTFPLAHGAAARVGRLRAYGNAIVPQVAAEVISAYMLG